jgi:hypothetical protein
MMANPIIVSTTLSALTARLIVMKRHHLLVAYIYLLHKYISSNPRLGLIMFRIFFTIHGIKFNCKNFFEILFKDSIGIKNMYNNHEQFFEFVLPTMCNPK